MDFIHEPVLSGALPGTRKSHSSSPSDPTFYANNPAQFYLSCNAPRCTLAASQNHAPFTPAGDGSFSQNVQRLGFYAQDSWRVTPHLTIDYGLRYDTTFGLFTASGQSQLDNPALLTLRALQIPFFRRGARTIIARHSRRAWELRTRSGESESTVMRAGFGRFYNDLAQNGWVTAFAAVNTAPALCVHARRSRMPSRLLQRWRGRADRSGLQNSLRTARHRGHPAFFQFALDGERRLHA